MIERLQRALEHIEELSPEAQEDLAVQIEEMTEPIEAPTGSLAGTMPDLPDDAEETLLRWRHESIPTPPNEESLPKSVRDALAVFGAARDLQYDDEFEALDRIRHESTPTPPIELDDL